MLPGTRLPNPRGWLKGSQAYDCIIFQLLLLPTTLLVAYLVVLLFTSLLPTVLRTAHCHYPHFFYPALAAISIRLPCGRENKKKNKNKNTKKNKRHSPKQRIQKSNLIRSSRDSGSYSDHRKASHSPPTTEMNDDSYTFDNKKYTKYTHSSIPVGL